MNLAPVAITGMGSITCNGIGPKAIYESAIAGKSGIEKGLGPVDSAVVEKLSKIYPDLKGKNLALIFSIPSIWQAMMQANWQNLNNDDGLILATTTGQISIWENALIQYLEKTTKDSESILEFSRIFKEQPLGMTLNNISEYFNFLGRSLLITSACSASTQALAIGADWIRTGKVKRCLVGGVEVLSQLTTQGFGSLQLLSGERAKPFDINRSGINLSEGSAFFCLEKKSSNPLAFLTGSGFSMDGYHLASPHPEGMGSFKAMQKAIETSGVPREDVTWVHSHGTGSMANDQAEGAAISVLFENISPPVSSTKWVHGHGLGASGAIETALCLESMRHSTILKTQGLKDPDPKIKINHLKNHLQVPVKHILKNTLGFGGNNAAIMISHPDWTVNK